MANLQSLADVLQAIGFSDLIENFESVPFEGDVQGLLTDAAIVGKTVPEQYKSEFIDKIENFFSDKIDVRDESSEDSDVDVGLNFEEENVDTNNIVKERKKNNFNKTFAIENVNIPEILQNTFEGRQILSWHAAKSFLKPGQRKRLVHYVVGGVMNLCDRPLHESDFKILSQKIVEVFPKECELVYYQPRIPKNKSRTGKPSKAKGKLLNKYDNLKKTIVQLNEVTTPAVPVEKDYENPLNEEIEESIDWLKTQEEPWEDTEKHWKITANYRRIQVENELTNKISSTYEEWPILKCPNGYKLIVQDFSYRKFTKEENSINNFKNFVSKALLAKPLRKDEHTDLLQGLLVKENLKEDNDVLIRLMLLCIVQPSTARIPVGNNKKWKPSSVESLEGIVTRVKIHGDIDKAKLERHLFARSRHLNVQPYLIVVEEDDYKVESTYLCIDDITYQMPSLLVGLDVCFKSFHVFKANYTVQSKQIWLLLQLGLYKFYTDWDTSEVNEILNDMGIPLPQHDD